jgi:hypothetical protein
MDGCYSTPSISTVRFPSLFHSFSCTSTTSVSLKLITHTLTRLTLWIFAVFCLTLLLAFALLGFIFTHINTHSFSQCLCTDRRPGHYAEAFEFVTNIIMGCGASKVEDLPLVTLCRERKDFIKTASDHRYALAAAHVSYFHSLKNIGDALRQFVDEELVIGSDSPSSPVLTLPSDQGKKKKRNLNDESSISHSASVSLNHSPKEEKTTTTTTLFKIRICICRLTRIRIPGRVISTSIIVVQKKKKNNNNNNNRDFIIHLLLQRIIGIHLQIFLLLLLRINTHILHLRVGVNLDRILTPIT